MQHTFQIIVSGQVQGVGFRPFVYKLARQLDLKGSVCNNESGVLIHINSDKKTADAFLQSILTGAPSIAHIQSHSITQVNEVEFDDFRIVPSNTEQQINIPLTPDFSICSSCKAEIEDETNRRYGYAFTTCTNCGPRYAVTTKFPFERANTMVSNFEMCSNCASEYENPTDRRFHSQTNSCSICGMQLELVDSSGIAIQVKQEDVLQEVAQLILEGKIVAIKNTNGYLLCCDANNEEVITRLREKKRRPTKPFALLYPTLEKVKASFNVSETEEQALVSSVAPIVILTPRSAVENILHNSIAPNLNQLGVMLPSSALIHLLMEEVKVPIIATSGNIHGSPIISEEVDVNKKLGGVADYFLHHDLEISFPQDDSVVRFAGKQQIVLRRSRGMAPNYLESKHQNKEIVLAMGAHLKSTFTYVPNSHTYVSQYFGNMDNYEVSERFCNSLHRFTDLFETTPQTILIDAHPQYQSSILGQELAEKWNADLISIQHHKAHFASVLEEYHLFDTTDKILGVVWDGTGLGDDKAIWGGEFFTYNNHEMQRLTHFEYVDWLAADKMAKEPRLSLLSMLPEEHREVAKDKFKEIEWKIYLKLLKNNTLNTSSVGRLFDAVASLLGLIDTASYEGEAAMLLEDCAKKYEGTDPIDFLAGISFEIVPTKQLLKRIYNALSDGIPKEHIADSFIHTLALMILKIATKYRFDCIACSGGVFQNAVLVEKLMEHAQNLKIELKFNRILSSNDENVSFGQLAYYQHIKN